MPAIMSWLWGFGAEMVLEFVAESDPMVRVLLANKQRSDWPYSRQTFLEALGRHFDVVRSEDLSMGTRTLYHVRPKT